MTTPGRTHIPWQTQTGQINELISYIGFLEAKVFYLQEHHENCSAWLSRSPIMDLGGSPYLPPDIVVANDETQLSPPSPTKEHFTGSSLTTLQPTSKKGGNNPRWKGIIDQMTKGWDRPSSWIDRRVETGLMSVEQNQKSLTLILGLRSGLPPSCHDGSQPSSPGSSSKSDALIVSARKYALDTKASQVNPEFVVQVRIFRELVFASLCVVMEQQGLPIDTINELMRICMSSSGPANLYRLRRGALWVNRVISGTMMKKMGWRHMSTDFFFLSGRPVSQYGLLWEACNRSFPYLVNRLAQISTIVEMPINGTGWIPFSIPLIIKQLVGDTLTLEQICIALDYEIDDL
ncbi:hypothetical protein D0Z07_6222 [Hyphodiscus hymeniophilus]|uniref:Uncharacterized protein n=1 Tax=Hyphodiscus hymeniophilus TaxID=353542 RepID=A0A9P6VFQ3_9HELO|nr:hypothetical protein D0Z07_6222 [Hyphodiscus hymeniophilus]